MRKLCALVAVLFLGLLLRLDALAFPSVDLFTDANANGGTGYAAGASPPPYGRFIPSVAKCDSSP